MSDNNTTLLNYHPISKLLKLTYFLYKRHPFNRENTPMIFSSCLYLFRWVAWNTSGHHSMYFLAKETNPLKTFANDHHTSCETSSGSFILWFFGHFLTLKTNQIRLIRLQLLALEAVLMKIIESVKILFCESSLGVRAVKSCSQCHKTYIIGNYDQNFKSLRRANKCSISMFKPIRLLFSFQHLFLLFTSMTFYI